MLVSTDYGNTKAKYQILFGPNSNPTPNYKFGSWIIAIWLNDGKHGQGTHINKMGSDIPAKNTLNTSKHFSPKYQPKPKPKNLKFLKESSLWMSIVCAWLQHGSRASVQGRRGELLK